MIATSDTIAKPKRKSLWWPRSGFWVNGRPPDCSCVHDCSGRASSSSSSSDDEGSGIGGSSSDESVSMSSSSSGDDGVIEVVCCHGKLPETLYFNISPGISPSCACTFSFAAQYYANGSPDFPASWSAGSFLFINSGPGWYGFDPGTSCTNGSGHGISLYIRVRCTQIGTCPCWEVHARSRLISGPAAGDAEFSFGEGCTGSNLPCNIINCRPFNLLFTTPISMVDCGKSTLTVTE